MPSQLSALKLPDPRLHTRVMTSCAPVGWPSTYWKPNCSENDVDSSSIWFCNASSPIVSNSRLAHSHSSCAALPATRTLRPTAVAHKNNVTAPMSRGTHHRCHGSTRHSHACLPAIHALQQFGAPSYPKLAGHFQADRRMGLPCLKPSVLI